MTAEQTELYLTRIGVYRKPELSVHGLTELMNRHLLTVPFENLDIVQKKEIQLTLPAMFNKIVLQRRGGFCYELNGLFAMLLKALGFTVTMHSARVHSTDGNYGPEFDHLMLLVEINGMKYCCDIGFGDFIFSPLPFVEGKPIEDRCGTFTVTALGGGRYRIDKLLADTTQEPQYIFSREQYTLRDFSGMCVYHSTSPESPFSEKIVCSIVTEDGRVTVHNRGVKITGSNGVKKSTFTNDFTVSKALELYFDIHLEL